MPLFFNKNEPDEHKPTLIGEDFDIFPDLYPKPQEDESADTPDVGNQEDAPLTGEKDEPEAVEEEDDDVEPTPFQKRVAAISEKNWSILQIAGGIALGISAALSMTFLSVINFFSTWGLLIAIMLALVVPGQLERQADRKVKKLRVTTIISMAAMFAFYALYGLVINPDYFSAR